MKLRQYSLRRVGDFAEFEWVIIDVNRDDICKIVRISYLYFCLTNMFMGKLGFSILI